MEGTQHVQVVNGIALINLIGPIYPRANVMTSYSGATSIQKYTNEFLMAYNNKDIKGVIQVVDSPGGDVRGIGESAKYINQAVKAGRKPVKTYASGYMASAAYYIGSTGQELISERSGMSGSIGVVLSGTKKDENSFEIVSSVSPNKRPDAFSDEGKSVLQQQVDDLAEIFVSDVAKYRGVDKQTILDNYGKGAVFAGPRAKKHGLVDRVSTLSQVIEEMERDTTTSRMTVGKAAGWSEQTIAVLFDTEGLQANGEPITDESLMEQEEKINMGLSDMMAKFLPSTQTIEGGDDEALNANQDVTVLTREELEAKFELAGENFSQKLVIAGHIFPAQQALAAVDFINASADDALITGDISYVNMKGELVKGSRVDAVRARYEAMPKHGVTEKAVAAIKDGQIAAKVLVEADEEIVTKEELDQARVDSLLAKTPAGRATMAARTAK